jgi:glycosyltransferase involved in cell wall biosynthesis
LVLRVYYLSEIPTPYRLPLLRRIAEHPNVELRVGFLSREHPDRPWANGGDLDHIPHEFLPGLDVTVPLGRETAHVQLNGILGRRLRDTDAVVVAGWSKPAELLAVAQARATHVPYLLHSESHVLAGRSGVKRAIKRVLLPQVVTHAAAGLATGSGAARYLAAYGLDAARVRIFPNTIDVAAYRERADAVRADATPVRERFGLPDRFWLYAGRLVDSKGIADLLAAHRALGADATPLVVAGTGPLAREVAAAKNVVALGFVQPGDLVDVFALAEATIVPSLEEPWGVVVNEALAVGCAVLASDAVGAAEDLIVPGENGSIYPAGDRDALARALRAGVPRGDPTRGRIAHWNYDWAVAQFLEAVELAVRS